MSFTQGLVRARSHLIFLFGLITAFSMVIWLESIDVQGAQGRKGPSSSSEAAAAMITFSEQRQATTTPRKLTEKEREWANIAWKYFKNNTVAETGLVNSVDGYQSSTLWDTSSYLMAIIAAERLQIIPETEFNERITAVLKSLAAIPLFDNQLPNKVYHTKSLAMVDYKNQAREKGIGWSAIDIGRVLVPFNILVWNYAEHTPAVEKVMQRWDLTEMIKDGTLYGADLSQKGKIAYLQEGRLGYEEYAAKSFGLMGMDVSVALDYLNYVNFVDIYGTSVATDSRDPDIYQAHNYVVSEPYILDGIEYGWDRISRELAWRVYEAQEKRYQETGILTAVSEDSIDQEPYFVYNTVFTDGKAWNAITEDGADASAYKTLSTKAAFGWHMIYETDYTRKLMERVAEAYDPERGWYAGIYEADNKPNKALTANTNGIVLETLAFRESGTLLKVGR
ncbi:MAG: DUF3131 domain-containing protein [Thiolinea sp.]